MPKIMHGPAAPAEGFSEFLLEYLQFEVKYLWTNRRFFVQNHLTKTF